MYDVSPPKVAPPLKNGDAEASEAELGFAVPAFLKLLYGKVGNGGFGPGYGLIGLMSGATDDQGNNAVGAYQLYSSSDPSDPTWNWPERLLPICTGGVRYTAVLTAGLRASR